MPKQTLLFRNASFIKVKKLRKDCTKAYNKLSHLEDLQQTNYTFIIKAIHTIQEINKKKFYLIGLKQCKPKNHCVRKTKNLIENINTNMLLI